MEHEVFVPAAQAAVRRALADPAQVARAIPGLQPDPEGTGPGIAGRLKVRVGGGSITYRGTLRVTARDDGSYGIEGEGTEVRGGGRVALALTLRIADVEGGCLLAFSGGASGEGRFADLDASVAATAGHRVLRKSGEELAAALAAPGDDTAPPRAPGGPAAPEPHADDLETGPAGTDEPMTPGPGGAEEPMIPDSAAGRGLGYGAEPPAEAAHARRTMIGRSAEEVDHAPPRGRYAPVPAAGGLGASAALRWAAPAAVVAFASAVVISRALRRRR